MKRDQLTEKILDIKRNKGWTWKHIAGEIGGWRGREVMAQGDRIQDRLMDIFRRAERQGLPPDRVADTLAEARFMGGDRQEPSCAA